MIKLFFTDADGSERTVEAVPGGTLMRAAVEGGIEGILADCGGNAQCATCHVYVDPAQLSLLPPVRSAEAEMLNVTAAPRLGNSRLSCQIVLTSAQDGLRVTVPPTQI